MPANILSAYARYQESLEVYNSLAQGLGSAHKHANGIPQGCPFSMMLVALMLRPWGSLMESIGTTPRTLADDLLVMADGPDHLDKIVDAANKTHHYLTNMGARVATQ